MSISNRVNQIKKSAIHEMTRLSKQYDDVAFLSWAKPTPGIAFGPTGENHIRLSFCVPEEMINKAFDRMEKYFVKNK